MADWNWARERDHDEIQDLKESVKDLKEENSVLLQKVVQFRKWLQWHEDRKKLLTSGQQYGIAKWLIENPEPKITLD